MRNQPPLLFHPHICTSAYQNKGVPPAGRSRRRAIHSYACKALGVPNIVGEYPFLSLTQRADSFCNCSAFLHYAKHLQTTIKRPSKGIRNAIKNYTKRAQKFSADAKIAHFCFTMKHALSLKHLVKYPKRCAKFVTSHAYAGSLQLPFSTNIFIKT